MDDVANFHHIFDAISPIHNYPSIIIQNKSITHVFTYIKQMNILTVTHHIDPTHRTEGFSVSNIPKIKVIHGLNICSCSQGGFILCEYICDDIIDCPNDESDEQYCVFENHNITIGKIWKVIKTEIKKICTALFYKSLQGTCQKFKEIKLRTSIRSQSLQGTCQKFKEIKLRTSIKSPNITRQFGNSKINGIPEILINDLAPDFSFRNKDEQVLISLLKYKYFNSCSYYELPCLEGHTKCFNLSDICIYKLNYYKSLIPCRNGAHIHNCIKFECHVMLKCQYSYCVPWSYVCDGKWDYPWGYDESICTIRESCKRMYKCRNTTYTCLHLANVCDGKNDCPLGDDEQLCKLKNVYCLPHCQCLLLAISCQDIDMQYMISFNFYQFSSVTIIHCNIVSINSLLKETNNVISLRLIGNNIERVCGLCHQLLLSS